MRVSVVQGLPTLLFGLGLGCCFVGFGLLGFVGCLRALHPDTTIVSLQSIGDCLVPLWNLPPVTYFGEDLSVALLGCSVWLFFAFPVLGSFLLQLLVISL